MISITYNVCKDSKYEFNESSELLDHNKGNM